MHSTQVAAQQFNSARDLTVLRGQITALQARIATLEAQRAAVLDLIDGMADASCEPGDDRYRPNIFMRIEQALGVE